MKPQKIAVLCSGGGTNFQAILGAQEAGLIPHGEVALLITDRAGAYALTRAARYGIPCAVFDRKEIPDRSEREKKIAALLKEREIGLVVLAGFMTVLSAAFVKEFEGRMINIHPALVPSFCGEGYYGLRVHEEALKRGVKVTGATVHYVTEVCDGGPIIAQKAVEVKEGDTPQTLQKRVMQEAEWVILPRAVETVCEKLSGETK